MRSRGEGAIEGQAIGQRQHAARCDPDTEADPTLDDAGDSPSRDHRDSTPGGVVPGRVGPGRVGPGEAGQSGTSPMREAVAGSALNGSHGGLDGEDGDGRRMSEAMGADYREKVARM